MKLYAVEIDVSPSEQLTTNDDDLKAMALVFGLGSRSSLELVGDAFPENANRFTLRKWAGRPDRYKRGFVQHARMLVGTGKIVIGMNVTNDRAIRRIGASYWQEHMQPFPENPSSHNRRGRRRHKFGNYVVDGVNVAPFEILEDELILHGWYASSLSDAKAALVNAVDDDVQLEVVIDRLPGDSPDNRKAVLLKELCRKATNNTVEIVGVPDVPDALQRELLVDNVAGLGREVFDTGDDALYGGGRDVFGFWRDTREAP